jgi:hypothetical protein
MAWSTPKTDWAAGNTPLHTDFNRAEGNTAVLGNLRTYPTAGGTATAITLTTGYFELTAGRGFTFIASADNSGAATTINADGLGAKSVYKPGGTDAPAIISGKAYTVWYNGTNFFVKASAEGDADAGDVLKNKTFSNDSDVGIAGTLELTGDAIVDDVLAGKKFYKDDAKTQLTGTLPNNAGDVNAVSFHSGGGGTIHVIPAKGYTDGTDDASVITDADFVVTNIKHNVEIFGSTGSYDTEAVSPIAAGTVLDGKIGFVNGAKVTGTMPDKSGGGANNVTVSYTNNEVAIPEGYYDGTETKAVLSLVTSGANQVYTTGPIGIQSATYVTLASPTVNYPGTYKITVITSTNASYDDLGVKVNGQLKAIEDGTVTYDAFLTKGMTFLVEGYIDSIFGATLTVDVTCYIAEPTAFIA